MTEKFLFNFLTVREKKRKEKKKPRLTVLPNRPDFQKTAHVKAIISSRNETELRCEMIKVTDIMFLRGEHALTSWKGRGRR